MTGTSSPSSPSSSSCLGFPILGAEVLADVLRKRRLPSTGGPVGRAGLNPTLRATGCLQGFDKGIYYYGFRGLGFRVSIITIRGNPFLYKKTRTKQTTNLWPGQGTGAAIQDQL